jgi:DNA-binding transcriptional LysR family regulator
LHERPGIALDILWTERVRLVDWVASGKMGAALINAAHGHTEVETKLLSNQGAMCGLPPAYALAQRGEIFIRDLEGLTFVSWSEGALARVKMDALFTHARVARAAGFSTSTAPAGCVFVASSLGMAKGAVSIRSFTAKLERDVLLAYPKRASLPPLAREFADEAKRQARLGAAAQA